MSIKCEFAGCNGETCLGFCGTSTGEMVELPECGLLGNAARYSKNLLADPELYQYVCIGYLPNAYIANLEAGWKDIAGMVYKTAFEGSTPVYVKREVKIFEKAAEG